MSKFQDLNIGQAISRAKKAIKQGDIPVAAQLYNTILQKHPKHTAAKKALRKLQKKFQHNQVIKEQIANPSQDDINALIKQYNSGMMAKAEQNCEQLLQTYPQSFILFRILGVVLKEQGKLQEAIKAFNKAIQLKPDYPEAYFDRGITFENIGQIDEAVSNYDKAIQLKPDYVDAYLNHGNALKDLGQLEEAVKDYDKVIALRSDCGEAYNNRGVALKKLGKYDKAIKNYQLALKIKSDSYEANKSMYWVNFANCLRNIDFTSYDDNLGQYLLKMLDQPEVDPNSVTKSCLRALHHHPSFLDALVLLKADEIDDTLEQLITRLSNIPLLIRLMELCIITDREVENMLTQVRKAILNKAISEDFETYDRPFYAALVMQCFSNEYVFYETEDERQKIDHFQEKIENILENGNAVPSSSIAVLLSYRPLSNFLWSEKLLGFDWSDDIKRILIRQIEEVKVEKAIRVKIPSLSPIYDKVSLAVQRQYEENPYPRWVKTGLSHKPDAIQKVLQKIKLHPDVYNKTFSDKPDILVAGCGTGRHAIGTASRFLNCNVLAVDLSFSSLAYAMRKTQELGISNIEYIQGDILELKKLDRQFDIIESSGVLHHMDDPLAGWQVLVDILRSGGLMKIGLYSEIARKQIVAARKIIKQKKIFSTPENIREFRRKINKISSDKDSGLKELVNVNAFFSMSEFRDLLFHVQEYRFSLLQLKAALKDLGMTFLGFEFSDNKIKKQFRLSYPKKDALYSLALWHEFELSNPSTFLGMYQFWLQKK